MLTNTADKAESVSGSEPAQSECTILGLKVAF
jgi:hypothetical protein